MQKKRNRPLPRRILRFLKRQFRNPGKRLAIELTAVVVIIGIVIFMALSKQDIATDDVKDGIDYIKGLEAQDTAPIEEEVKDLRKEERKKAGLTQDELARRIGTKKTYISRIENGKSDVQLSTLFKIFQGLGKRVNITIL